MRSPSATAHCILFLTVMVGIFCLPDRAFSQDFDHHYTRAGQLSRYPDSIGLAIHHAKEAVDRAFEARDVEQVGKGYWLCGYLTYLKGDLLNSFNYYLSARKAYQRLNKPNSLVQIEENLGSIALDNGSYLTAIRMYGKRLETARKINNKAVAEAYFDLGVVHYFSDDLATANQFYLDALHIYETSYQSEDSAALARVYNELGAIQFQLGKDLSSLSSFDSARFFYSKALELGQSPATKSMALNNLGKAFLAQENYIQAEKYLEEALTIKKQLQNTRLQVVTLNNLGILRFQQEDLPAAAAYFDGAIDANVGWENYEANKRDIDLAIEMNQNAELYESFLYLDSIKTMAPEIVFRSDPSKVIQRYHENIKSIILFEQKENERLMELSLKEYEEEARREKMFNTIMLISVIAVSAAAISFLGYKLVKWHFRRKEGLRQLKADKARFGINDDE